MSDNVDAKRAATVLGWVSGLLLGLLVDYLGYVRWGDDYPKGYSTFVLLAGGAFLGMAIADRLRDRALKVMAFTAGLLLAALLFAFFVPLD